MEINRGILQDGSLSPVLFIVSLLSLILVFRKMKQGYSFVNGKLSHLFFMDNLRLYCSSQSDIDSLTQTVYNLRDDVGMRFGIDSCGVLAMRKGKESECE